MSRAWWWLWWAWPGLWGWCSGSVGESVCGVSFRLGNREFVGVLSVSGATCVQFRSWRGVFVVAWAFAILVAVGVLLMFAAWVPESEFRSYDARDSGKE